MNKMSQSDIEELEKYRAQRKKNNDYRNNYAKENYRRMVCLYPINDAPIVDKARGDLSISNYLVELINRDLKEKGLID